MVFIFDELRRNLRSCLIFSTICGFFGLCVITSGNVCDWRVVRSLFWRNSVNESDFALVILCCTSVFGYSCDFRNSSSSCSLWVLNSDFETMLQILLARQYGMFCLVCFGWQELKFRYYWCVSVFL